MSTRGTSNSNARGSTLTRKRRRAWIMAFWQSDVAGYVRCYRCGSLLREENLTIDRIVPGCDGGKYTRGNIRPACGRCNSEHGGGLRSER